MSAFAKGSRAIAFCQRCGRQIPYLELKAQVQAELVTELLVCWECLDIDRAGEDIEGARFAAQPDPQALFDARPDPDLVTSRGEAGWNPVSSLDATFQIGQVRAA